MQVAYVYVDASRSKKGAGIGIVIKNSDNIVLKEHKEFLSDMTSNQAEYRALIKALKMCRDMKFKAVKVFSHSELIINQLKGIYKVKNRHLLELFKEVKILEEFFNKVKYYYIPRSINRDAGKLANEAVMA